jgi:hypothetical protein
VFSGVAADTTHVLGCLDVLPAIDSAKDTSADFVYGPPANRRYAE